ncbi:MAG: protein-disulfide reductase DsbD family protein [Micavibrio sp.]
MKHLLIAALIFLINALHPVMAQPANDDLAGPHVTITMTPERNTIGANESIWIAMKQTIAPHWHTYFLNPGDSGAEPRITWSLPEGMSAGQIVWPAPKRIPYAGLVNYGYEGSATTLQKITAPATLPDGPLTLTAEIEILVCRDICIPETSTQSITLNDPAAAPQDNSATIADIWATLPAQTALSANYSADATDFLIEVTSADTNFLSTINLQSLAIFPAEWGLILNAPVTRSESLSPEKILLRHVRDTRDLGEVSAIETILTYQTKEGEDRAVLMTMNPAPAPVAQTDNRPEDSLTLIQALLFALFGGLILNLMPCVFPVLSLKALKLIDLQSKGRGIAALHGITYTAGVLLSFAVIGGILLSIKLAGGDTGWGFQLQNPLIILALAYLLFIIGLNLSGLFEIGGSFTGAGSSLTAKSGLTGSFFTGVLATLVATPCTAPFMAGALGFALVQPAPIAMAIFLALGFGLALPYLLLSIVPALARLLPKPGAWMVKFKEALAFPMYASAAWMVWVLSMQTGPSGIMWALSGMVAIAFAIWLVTHRPANKGGRFLLLVTAFMAVSFSVMPFVDQSVLRIPGTAIPTHTLPTEDFSQARFDELIAGDEPVFTYMTAAWCITCKVNEKIALNTAETKTLFEENGVVALKGDWTNMNAEITNFLKRHGRSGVPLYLFHQRRDGETGERPEPVLLPQILTPGLMADTIIQKP